MIRNKKKSQSTSLLIWESIQASLRKKISYYNFGGTWPNQSELYLFKPDWKNDLIGLHTFNHDHGCTVIDTRRKRNRFG